MAKTAGIPALGANSAKPFKTLAAQSLAGLTPCATMPKASGLAIVGSAVSWHLVAVRVSLGVPPEKGGAGLENPSEYPVLYACQSASSSDGAGWQSVRVPWRAVRGGLRARRLGYSPVFETRTVRRLYLVALLSVLYGALP